ncbi:MAG: alpha-E domain-containing protein [Chloroflexi bacterium]|nr:alpha-E domain-containing protein [Chloroflexota bacterium]
MLSRIAESLYWLGRYLERAENVARMVHVDYLASIESGALAGQATHTWDALIAATGAREAFMQALADGGERPAAEFLVLARDNPNSIRSTVGLARELARTLRPHISREVWEEINTLYLSLSQRRAISDVEIYDLCGSIKRSIETVFGLYDNTVIFDEGREWFRCGLFVERADMTTRILDTKYHLLLPAVSEVGGPLDRYQWMAILRSASAWEAFRKSGLGEISGARVVQMLLFNADFPRSVFFCVRALERHYLNATLQTPRAQRVHAQRVIALLALDIAASDARATIRDGLHEYLDDVQKRLIEVDHAMTDAIFRALPEAI